MGSGSFFYLVALVLLGGAVFWTRRRPDESELDRVAPGSSRALPSALLAVAFLVLAVRAVLMVRWPLLPAEAASTTGGWLPAVGLPHHLVVVLALFTVGLYSASVEDDPRRISRGLVVMLVAAAIGLTSVVRFVGGRGEESTLVALVVAAAVATTWLSRRLAAPGTAAADRGAAVPVSDDPAAAVVGDDVASAGSDSPAVAGSEGAANHVPATVLAVLAGVTLALLAGAW